MNCTTAQGKPWATQRTIMPKAEEDLPLPAPVWTMIRPFSPLLVAMILSRATFFFAIFEAWRASVSSAVWVSGSGVIGRGPSA
ncbi:hypothetical protein ACVWXM_000348 [Bradyrhizobium sp. GM7.3]